MSWLWRIWLGDSEGLMKYICKLLFESIVLGVILALCIYFVFNILELE